MYDDHHPSPYDPDHPPSSIQEYANFCDWNYLVSTHTRHALYVRRRPTLMSRLRSFLAADLQR